VGFGLGAILNGDQSAPKCSTVVLGMHSTACQKSHSRSRSPPSLNKAVTDQEGTAKEAFLLALRQDGDEKQSWPNLKAALDKLPREALISQDKDKHSLLYFAARTPVHALNLVKHIESLWKKHSFVPPSDVMCDGLSGAAWSGNADVCEHVLDSKIDVNIANERGRTALFYCVQVTGNDEDARIAMTKLLIKRKADVQHRDSDGQTPIFRAARSTTSSETVELLLKKGADADALDIDLRSPVFNAARAGYCPTLRLLAHAKADIHRLDKFKTNAVRFAIKASREEAAMVLFQEFGAGLPISVFDLAGQTDAEGDGTCLSMATERGMAAVRDRLLVIQACFANVKNESAQSLHNLISSYPHLKFLNVAFCGKTLLHEAAARMDKEGASICDLLIHTHGISVNAIDYGGRTPLSSAAQHCSLHTVRFLLKAQADANVVDQGGCCPLFYAVRGGKATAPVVSALQRATNEDAAATTFLQCRRDCIKTRDQAARSRVETEEDSEFILWGDPPA